MLHKEVFMKLIRRNEKYFFIVVSFLIIITSCSHKPFPYTKLGTAITIQQKALSSAMLQMNKPYKLGGQGPDEFDCSGLIIYAYENALESTLLLVNKRNEITNDVNADELYMYNTIALNNNQVIPGDIVFITGDEERITHAGLFVGWKDEYTIEFINASYYYGEVCLDEWPLEGTKRDQWVAGFGRLMVRCKQ